MENIQPIYEVINKYDKEIINYLLSKNFHGHRKPLNCNIIDSIDNIIETALKDAPAINEIPAIQNNPELKNSDCIFFGDVHGQLDLFVQNLYISGIIEKDGSLKKTLDKSVIQLGDTVDKGAFQFETLVYLRMLKNEAAKQGIDFHYLAGNHELNSMLTPKDNIEDKLIGKMLKEDIQTGVVKLSYTHPQKNIISFHSSMEKEILLDSLILMCDDPSFCKGLSTSKTTLEDIKESLKEKHRSKNSCVSDFISPLQQLQEKTSYKKIYSTLSKVGISLNDVSKWLNSKFKEVILNDTLNENSPYYNLFSSPSGFTRSKLKATIVRHHERGGTGVREFLIRPDEIKYNFKPIQISGHKQTVFGVKGAFGNKGGIMQNKANIFADSGLVDFYGGYQAFVALNSKNNSLYAVEFLDKNKAISGLLQDKAPSLLVNKIQNIKVRKLESLKVLDRSSTSPYT